MDWDFCWLWPLLQSCNGLLQHMCMQVKWWMGR